jgi:hypothetical protein
MADARPQVMVEMEAMGLIGARVALFRCHHRLEALAPMGGDGVESQAARPAPGPPPAPRSAPREPAGP